MRRRLPLSPGIRHSCSSGQWRYNNCRLVVATAFRSGPRSGSARNRSSRSASCAITRTVPDRHQPARTPVASQWSTQP